MKRERTGRERASETLLKESAPPVPFHSIATGAEPQATSQESRLLFSLSLHIQITPPRWDADASRRFGTVVPDLSIQAGRLAHAVESLFQYERNFKAALRERKEERGTSESTVCFVANDK